MKKDSKLGRMMHVLIHMSLRGGRATSDTIAQMLATNPVVVRRTMAGLKARGYVISEGGHGGGWQIMRPLAELTVLDIYTALEEPELFAMACAQDHPGCPVEQASNAALRGVLDDAEALMRQRMASITLAQIASAVVRD